MASPEVQIVTDSTCALPPDLSPELRARVAVAPATVQFGERSYIEGEFTLDWFYDEVGRHTGHPTTAQPPPSLLRERFESAVARGPVLGIFVSGALSGTYSVASAIASEMEGDIHCVDSRAFSSALGYMVAEAVQGAAEGQPRAALVDRLHWRRAQTALYIAIEEMSFLRRSGRANLLQAGLATLLSIRPLLALEEGRLATVGRARTRRQAHERLVALAEAHAATLAGPLWISAMHGRAEAAAASLLATLTERLPVSRAFVSEIPASIAVHGGPGVVGVMVTPEADVVETE